VTSLMAPPLLRLAAGRITVSPAELARERLLVTAHRKSES
jgi:hypothetical protein